jgi:hypothetical protein
VATSSAQVTCPCLAMAAIPGEAACPLLEISAIWGELAATEIGLSRVDSRFPVLPDWPKEVVVNTGALGSNPRPPWEWSVFSRPVRPQDCGGSVDPGHRPAASDALGSVLPARWAGGKNRICNDHVPLLAEEHGGVVSAAQVIYVMRPCGRGDAPTGLHPAKRRVRTGASLRNVSLFRTFAPTGRPPSTWAA